MDNESNTATATEQLPTFQTQSSEINELAGALSLAQGDMNPAKKGASNPFFKSKYADLAEVIEASRQPLSENDLSIVQYADDGFVVTQLMHSSGQWIRGRLRIQPKDNTPQGIGSALSYARRYSWQMLIGQASGDDDDGEAAMGRAGSAYDPAHAKPAPKKKANKRKPAPKKEEKPKTVTTGEVKQKEPKTKTTGEVLEDGKGNSAVMTVEQEEKEDALELPQQEDADDAESIIKAVPHAGDYLKSLNIDPKKVPNSVQERIVEKGLDGFGEMVAGWIMEQKEQEQ